MSTKTCTKCKKELPATTEYFQKQKAGKYGLQPKCKACAHEYYLANRQKYIDQAMEWQRNNHERRLEHRREWGKRNKQYLKAYQDRQRKLYPDRVRTRVKGWLKRHPHEAKLLGKTNAARRQARKRKLPDNFTSQDWLDCVAYFNNRCAVCERPAGLWHTLAADHWIPLTSPDCPGTIPTNIVPLCHGIDGCNNSKGGTVPEVWLVDKFGEKKAKQILERIREYFRSLFDC